MAKTVLPPSVHLSLQFVGLLWMVFIIDVILPFPLSDFGILPRTIFGLRGILFCPLLHGNFGHIAANSLGLFGLSMLFLVDLPPKKAASRLASIWLATGAGTWLFARGGTMHIGASGLIFGLLGFLIIRGLMDRDFKGILIGGIAAYAYGGIIFGVLPQDGPISWESHLIGLLSGAGVAYHFHK